MSALATDDDYIARYGGTTSELLETRLDDASAAVRAYTGQQFEAATATQILRVVAGKIRLPQRPVVAVTSVAAVNPDGTTTTLVGWAFDGIDQISTPSQSFVLNLPEAFNDTPFNTCEVVWDYGYDEIPTEIIAIVCAATNRALTAGTSGGMQRETIGSYSYGMSDDHAAAGAVGFTTAERNVLNLYRRTAAALQT